MPSESEMSEFGKLLQDIENSIYQSDANPELKTQWINALEIIRGNYQLAFVSPEMTGDTENLVSNMLNAGRLLKDYKFRQWLERREKEIDEDIARINNGQISQLLEQEDRGHKVLPRTMIMPKFDANGHLQFDENGNLITEEVPYNFGEVDRRIRDKLSEIDRLMEKHRNQWWLEKWYRRLRGTLGSSQAMADLSYIGIQGHKQLALFATNPRLYLSATKKSLRVLRNEFSKNPGLENEVYKTITENDDYAEAMYYGLAISSPDAHIYVNEMLSEDDQFDIWHEKLKGRRNVVATGLRGAFGGRKKIKTASNAAFATQLNLLLMNRYSEYKEMVRKKTGNAPTPRELEAYVHSLNASVGRTTRLLDATKGMAYVLWAPRLYLSQTINLANVIGDPVAFLYHWVRGEEDLKRVYGIRAVNSVIYATTTTLMYMMTAALAKLACGENYGIQANPAKPSFLKIDCGELSLDPTGNVRQWLTLGGRLFAALDGEPYTDWMNRPVPMYKTVMEAFNYKWNPAWAFGFQFLGATDFLGRPKIPDDQSWGKWKSRLAVLAESLLPIGGGSVVDVFNAKGLDGIVPPIITKPLFMMKAILGFTVQRISQEAEQARAAAEQAKKERKAAEKAGDRKEEIKKEFGEVKELEGDFISEVAVSKMTPTKKRIPHAGKTYKVFQSDTDEDGDGSTANDVYFVMTRKSGEHKGKKYFERIKDLSKIRE